MVADKHSVGPYLNILLELPIATNCRIFSSSSQYIVVGLLSRVDVAGGISGLLGKGVGAGVDDGWSELRGQPIYEISNVNREVF